MKIQKIRMAETNILAVDGVPQSIYPQTEGGYWKHMIPDSFSGQDVLLLGVGAGTVARLLLEKYPSVKIIGVDNNTLVLDVASRQFGLDDIDMKIEVMDGFEYVKKTDKKFDLILVDMWSGYWFPFKVLSQNFIEDCKKRLNPNGQVYINTPNLDYLAQEGVKGLEAYRDDIGMNVIYRGKLTIKGK